jgi:NDP-sugar pyrophosphorylase family protein
MVLAAGLGTRLQPLTYLRAKPAIPLLNRPLISYALELMARTGIQDVVVNLHHLPESVRQAVSESGVPNVNVEYSFEEQILGTAGGIGKVRDAFKGHTIIVANGKIYFEDTLQQALDFHHASRSMVTLVVVPYRKTHPFQPILMDAENNIVSFTRNLPEGSNYATEALAPFVFTGIHIMESEVLEQIPEGPSDTVRDTYPLLIREGLPVKGYTSSAYWCECSTPSRYLANSLELLRRRRMNLLGSPELDTSRAGFVVAGSFQPPGGPHLEDCLAWRGAEIGLRSSYRRVIICGGIAGLPSESHWEDVILMPPVSGQPPPVGSRTGDTFVEWPLGSQV